MWAFAVIILTSCLLGLLIWCYVRHKRWRDETALIRAIYQRKKYHIVLNIAGGGSSVIGKLLSVPGASNVVIEARVAYAQGSIDELAGAKPARYTSFEVARGCASWAFYVAQRLGEVDDRFQNTTALGFGCTGCLKPCGKGSAFVAIFTRGAISTLRWSQGKLVPPSMIEPDSLCIRMPLLLRLPYHDIVGSRESQEQALAHNILWILHAFATQ